MPSSSGTSSASSSVNKEEGSTAENTTSPLFGAALPRRELFYKRECELSLRQLVETVTVDLGDRFETRESTWHLDDCFTIFLSNAQKIQLMKEFDNYSIFQMMEYLSEIDLDIIPAIGSKNPLLKGELILNAWVETSESDDCEYDTYYCWTDYLHDDMDESFLRTAKKLKRFDLCRTLINQGHAHPNDAWPFVEPMDPNDSRSRPFNWLYPEVILKATYYSWYKSHTIRNKREGRFWNRERDLEKHSSFMMELARRTTIARELFTDLDSP